VVSPAGHSGAVSSARASSGDPLGVRRQVEFADQFPAAGAVLAAHRRVGAALRLVRADRGGRHPRPDLRIRCSMRCPADETSQVVEAHTW
jgi:hypothetical protein